MLKILSLIFSLEKYRHNRKSSRSLSFLEVLERSPAVRNRKIARHLTTFWNVVDYNAPRFYACACADANILPDHRRTSNPGVFPYMRSPGYNAVSGYDSIATDIGFMPNRAGNADDRVVFYGSWTTRINAARNHRIRQNRDTLPNHNAALVANPVVTAAVVEIKETLGTDYGAHVDETPVPKYDVAGYHHSFGNGNIPSEASRWRDDCRRVNSVSPVASPLVLGQAFM
jgi:hypothetical protein